MFKIQGAKDGRTTDYVYKSGHIYQETQVRKLPINKSVAVNLKSCLKPTALIYI